MERRKSAEGGEEEGEGGCREEALLRGQAEALFWLFQASGLWLQALADHRGQCEAGLFGDVFSAGPVCLFSAFLALSTSGVEEEEEDRVWLTSIDNGPRAGLQAGRILSWGLGTSAMDF